MFTTYSEAREEFEKWIDGMSPADSRETVGVGMYRVVHGLVVMGVYLLGHPQFEKHRSDLMAEYGAAWFTVRADGSIAHAENPPKRYDDIVPLNFDSDDWPGLWQALADVVRHWRAQGVRVFRVDNPHTKPLRSGSG